MASNSSSITACSKGTLYPFFDRGSASFDGSRSGLGDCPRRQLLAGYLFYFLRQGTGATPLRNTRDLATLAPSKFRARATPARAKSHEPRARIFL